MVAEPDVLTEINEAEDSLFRYIDSLYRSAKKAKDPVENKVRTFEDLWRGKHWSDRTPKHRTRSASNFIFAIVETEVTWLTENRPSLIVNPMSAEDEAPAKIVERIILDYLWPLLEIRKKLKRMIRSALIRGKGFLKVTWDNLANPQMGGEVAVDYIPWHEVYIDPAADSLDTARYVIHARRMPVSEIVRRWPENGWRVQPDPEHSDIDDDRVFSAETDLPIISASGEVGDNRYKALVIECWMKDDSYEMREEFDSDTGEVIEYPHFLYPNGRLTIVANGVVLVDGPNPYHDGRFPFVELVGYEVDDSPWDMGEVEQLEPIQRVINILESRFIDNARLMTNTVWVKSKDAGISADKITNAEGAVYTINHAKARFERLPPQPLPAHYFNLYLQLQRNMETITGIHDVTQGRNPTGITAASAISLLQEAGQARIRDKARNLEDAIVRMGDLIVSRILQFYDASRIVRLRSEAGEALYVQFDPSQVRVGLDVWVEAGSSLQMNEQQRFQMAVEIFRAGGIDVPALLETTNFPNRDAIIQRFRSGNVLPPIQAPTQPSGAGVASGAVAPLPPAPGAPVV